MSASRPALSFIFFTLLLDVLGIGLIIPVAPKLVAQLSGHEGHLPEAAGIVGLLTATYAAMQFVFAPILGSLSDRFGRRPVILVSLLGSGLDYFAMALAPTLPWLFVTRALNGLSGANITACAAYIADVTTPEKRAAGYGLMGAAFGLGFVLGPLMGGMLGKIDIHYPFYAAGALTLLNWLYGYFVLPESLPPERRRAFSWARGNPVGVFKHLAGKPLTLGLAAVLFMLNLAQFGLHATWVLYTGFRYGWDERAVGYSLAVVGIGAAIVQGGLARKVVPRLGEARSILLGIAIGVCAYIGYGLATQGWMIYAIIAVGSLGAIFQPACQALISKSVSPMEQGEVQGALASLQCVANLLGALIGGHIFEYFASDRAPISLPGASFFVSALFAAIGLGIAAWILTRSWGRVSPEPIAEKSALEPSR